VSSKQAGKGISGGEGIEIYVYEVFNMPHIFLKIIKYKFIFIRGIEY
jgi:hypothetical protein